VVEAIQAADELVMWQAEGRAVDAVTDAGARLGRSTVRTAAWLGAARSLVLLVTAAGVAAVAAVVTGAVSGPVLALLVLLPLAMGEVAGGLTDAGVAAARTAAAEERLAELCGRDPAVVEDAVPVRPGRDPRLTVDRATGAWGNRIAFSHLSLDLAVGDRVGVVGPSGSGKSTLAALLLRFLDPAEGDVELAGQPLDALALDDVRSRVGLVDDDPHVFASTLAENVRLARPGADDAAVEGAIRAAGLGPWLDSLPHGLNTWLGDGHAQVSGGERARIAVARSLLADQPVLVLDEPTAHLDGATAEGLAEEVLAPGSGRTVVWISHGTVGLDRVDRVVDLGATQPTAPST
jgi:ATP-binding cassette subfamily C protein CydCD